MIWPFVFALSVSALAAVGVWLARGRLLLPVRSGAGEKISVVVSVTGSAPELENTVRGLLWLRGNGTLRAEIVVRDCGMDSAAKSAAEIMARSGKISLIPAKRR
ncbi:MAG: hypothetical protein LUC36_08430 [Oscillospiraceae bacterium]|nr:hypothetical protein [Oscillospiraceae bacterium]